MRELKFRAWDKSRQSFHWRSSNLMLDLQGQKWWQFGMNVPEFVNQDDFILEQFTSLHDKNGKEIYEGDMLRFPAKHDWDKENYSAFEVFFHDNDMAGCHVGFQMNRMHNYGSVSGGYCGHPFLPKTTTQMIIIGNIHENPELLDKEAKQ